MLEFDHEEVKDFIETLQGIADELEEQIDELNTINHDSGKGMAYSQGMAMNDLSISQLTTDLEFYENIIEELTEFIEEVDDSVVFSRNPDFAHSDDLEQEIEEIREEFFNMVGNLCLLENNYPTKVDFPEYGVFHKKPEEQKILIEENDKSISTLIETLQTLEGEGSDNIESMEDTFKLYFSDLTLEEWTTSIEDARIVDADDYRSIMRFAQGVTGLVGLGAMVNAAKGTKPNIPNKLPDNVENWKYKPTSVENYYKNQSVYENPKYFNQETGSINWPKNNGFAGEIQQVKLKPGTRIDRYGGEGGKYTSPKGTPFEKRALSPSSQEEAYHEYELLREITVESGEVASWFDEIGGGTQHYSDIRIKELLDENQPGGAYIREIK